NFCLGRALSVLVVTVLVFGASGDGLFGGGFGKRLQQRAREIALEPGLNFDCNLLTRAATNLDDIGERGGAAPSGEARAVSTRRKFTIASYANGHVYPVATARPSRTRRRGRRRIDVQVGAPCGHATRSTNEIDPDYAVGRQHDLATQQISQIL